MAKETLCKAWVPGPAVVASAHTPWEPRCHVTGRDKAAERGPLAGEGPGVVSKIPRPWCSFSRERGGPCRGATRPGHRLTRKTGCRVTPLALGSFVRQRWTRQFCSEWALLSPSKMVTLCSGLLLPAGLKWVAPELPLGGQSNYFLL